MSQPCGPLQADDLVALERLMPLGRELERLGLRDAARVLVERHSYPVGRHAVRRIEAELHKRLNGEAADLQRACAGMILLALNHQRGLE